jgi:hypothetical protein
MQGGDTAANNKSTIVPFTSNEANCNVFWVTAAAAEQFQQQLKAVSLKALHPYLVVAASSLPGCCCLILTWLLLPHLLEGRDAGRRLHRPHAWMLLLRWLHRMGSRACHRHPMCRGVGLELHPVRMMLLHLWCLTRRMVATTMVVVVVVVRNRLYERSGGQ